MESNIIFKCKFCGKCFHNKGGYATHINNFCKNNPNRNIIDFKLKNFKTKKGGWTCEICKLNFKTQRELKEHTAKNHISKKNKWYCYCGQSFKTRNELEHHKKENCEFCKNCREKGISYTNKEVVCPFCGKKWNTSEGGFQLHKLYCKSNPDRLIKKGHSMTEKNKKHMSELAKERHLGGYKKGGGRGKKGFYKGYWCDSSWELAYVIYNIEHGIPFKRNTEKFPYKYDNKIHNYLPDFIEEDTYIEIKGFYTDQVMAKYKQFPYKLNFLDKETIKPYLEYVENKYGKNFIELYDDYHKEENKLILEGQVDKLGRVNKTMISTKEWEERKKLILNSGVDLNKFGYVEKVVKATGLTKRQVRNTILKYNIEHFEKNLPIL